MDARTHSQSEERLQQRVPATGAASGPRDADRLNAAPLGERILASAETRRIDVVYAGDDSMASPGGAEVDAAGRTALLPVGASECTDVMPPGRLGPFEIKRRIGRGGMGTVYEAVQDDPRRSVALKVLRGGDWADYRDVQLFRREAQSLGRLNHPSVGAMYDSGSTDDGWHYIAMELIHGRPLTEYAARSTVTVAERLRLFRRVCLAVHHAHQRGVIHRDLKPSNILVDGSGQPKILDFGLARLLSRGDGVVTDLTQVGQIRGTFAYMSPEQAGGDSTHVDERTDVYALGVILYELLTGRRPFELTGRSVAQAIRTICDTEPARPGAIDASLRGDVETMILTAMHKSRHHRYATAEALAEDVHRVLTGRPILARRPAPAAGMSSGARPRRRVGALAAVLPLLVLCALAFQRERAESSRLRNERDAAAAARHEAEKRADAALQHAQVAGAASGVEAIEGAASLRGVAGAESAAGASAPPLPSY